MTSREPRAFGLHVLNPSESLSPRRRKPPLEDGTSSLPPQLLRYDRMLARAWVSRRPVPDAATHPWLAQPPRCGHGYLHNDRANITGRAETTFVAV